MSIHTHKQNHTRHAYINVQMLHTHNTYIYMCVCVCVCVCVCLCGPCNSVGKATDYGLDGPKSDLGGD